MKPEAGRHPSNPVVERSWDAILYNTTTRRAINCSTGNLYIFEDAEIKREQKSLFILPSVSSFVLSKHKDRQLIAKKRCPPKIMLNERKNNSVYYECVFPYIPKCIFLVFGNILFDKILMFGNILLSLQPRTI